MVVAVAGVDSVTVNTIGSVPASAPSASVAVTVTVGIETSLSRMEAVPVTTAPSVYPRPGTTERITVSGVGSKIRSSTGVTVSVAVIWPGLNVSDERSGDSVPPATVTV